jgi:hypothetical protein
MSGLQTIIDNCNGITINRRKVVGIQYTRNESPRTSLTPTYNPWRFSVQMPGSLRYNEARSLMEAIDSLDRYTPQTITFGNISCLNWIFRYQGAMTSGQIALVTVSDFTTNPNQLILNVSGVSASPTTVLFQPNDLIQIGTNPYPFTSTTQVLRGSGSTVTVTTNRPNVISTSVVGLGITVGNSCQFRVFCPNMPTYSLSPGGYQKNSSGVVVGNALINFDSEFELYEWVGTT